MAEDTLKGCTTQSPLTEVTDEPSLDILWGEQPDPSDAAIDFFIERERKAMRAYHERVNARNVKREAKRNGA